METGWGQAAPGGGLQPVLHKASSTQHEAIEPAYGAPGDPPEGPGQGGYLMKFLSEPSRGRLTSLHSPTSNAGGMQVCPHLSLESVACVL